MHLAFQYMIVLLGTATIVLCLYCCVSVCADEEKQTAPMIPKENVVQLGTHPAPKSADDDWWHQAHGTNAENIINF